VSRRRPKRSSVDLLNSYQGVEITAQIPAAIRIEYSAQPDQSVRSKVISSFAENDHSVGA